jgi:hypothetical protein
MTWSSPASTAMKLMMTLAASRSGSPVARMAPVSRLLRALEGAVASYRDGDFSLSIAATTAATNWAN